MILPIGVVSPGDTSPYAAQSAMAIDPMYLGLAHVPDFELAGGVSALSEEARRDLAIARAADRVDYARVRRVKHEALGLAFDRFCPRGMEPPVGAREGVRGLHGARIVVARRLGALRGAG